MTQIPEWLADKRPDQLPEVAAEIVRSALKRERPASPDKVRAMVRKLDYMETRTQDETGLDAEDNLTWHLRLMFSNDQETYDAWRAVVATHLASTEECPFCMGTGERQRGSWQSTESPLVPCEDCDGAGRRPEGIARLEDRLKGLAEELCGLESDSPMSLLAREMVGAALAWVNWYDLALGYLEQVKEETGDE